MTPWSTLEKAVRRDGPCALVTVTTAKGSTPRGTDAWMIVTANGFHGSIGGGTVEWRAMAEAQTMLSKAIAFKSLDYVLGPDLGQCCGGRMGLEIHCFCANDLPLISQRAHEAAKACPAIYIFGAGHVGRALVLALAAFDYPVMWVDSRLGAFPEVVPSNCTLHQVAQPTSILQAAPEKSFVFVMTHSHTLDFEIVDAALRHLSFQVGVIGSSTKRARFEKRLREAGISKQRVAQLICPIGVAGISSKLPAAIAASVVAQILQLESLKARADLPELQAQTA
jgi:xanthine dehydrogenase accessory factor